MTIVELASHTAPRRKLPLCVWLTGLPGAGKSTLAGLLERRLAQLEQRACILDGDALRAGLNSDLGYSDAHRTENVRRVAEVARLMVQAGVTPIVSLISPFLADRVLARARFAPEQFCEIFVDAPQAVCEQRDPKGLYAKARRGELLRFTGIDSPYEPPPHPDLHVRTDLDDAGQCVERIVALLRV
jgi:adenylyl-sulfate kinase